MSQKPQQTLLAQAITIASAAHQKQFRKGTSEPYILHPIRVYQNLIAVVPEVSEETAVAAILHDTLEDTDLAVEMIESTFGPVVLQMVQSLTNDSAAIGQMGKTAYLCEKVKSLNTDALLVKLSDRLDNVRDLQTQPRNWSEQYARSTWSLLDAVRLNPAFNISHNQLVVLIEECLKSFSGIM